MKTTLRSLCLFSGLAALATAAFAANPISLNEDRGRLGNLMDPARVNIIRSAHAADPLQPVTLNFTVTAKGVPRGIQVTAGSGHDDIDQRCVTFLKQQRFEPKKVNGVAVAREETLTLYPKIES
jgi:TonB family protein